MKEKIEGVWLKNEARIEVRRVKAGERGFALFERLTKMPEGS